MIKNDQYYRDSPAYRSRSPPRPRSSSLLSTRQQYSPPRNLRPRTPPPHRPLPPRNISPQPDRRFPDYSRQPERSRLSRSLPWLSQSSPPHLSSLRRDYYGPDRYRDPSPRPDSRRQFDFSLSHDEMYYTQPQYQHPSSHSPIPRTERRTPSVIDLDTWSPNPFPPLRGRHPSSPYYFHSSARDYNDRKRNLNTCGSRESPIYIDELYEPPARDYPRPGRWRNIRDSGAEKLIHEEWRPPPPPPPQPPVRARTPPRSWDANPRAQIPIEILDSPSSRRVDPNRANDEFRSYRENWVQPDRRGRPESFDERENEQCRTRIPIPYTRSLSNSSHVHDRRIYDNDLDLPPSVREIHFREKHTDRDGQYLSRQDDEFRTEARPRHTPGRARPAAIIPTRSENRSPRSPLQSRIVPGSKSNDPARSNSRQPSLVEIPNQSSAKSSRRDQDASEPASQKDHTTRDSALPSNGGEPKHLKNIIKDLHLHLESHAPSHQLDPSTSPDTSNENDELVHHMAKHARELIVVPDPPSPIVAPAMTSIKFASPPGLNMIRPLTKSADANSVSTVAISPELQAQPTPLCPPSTPENDSSGNQEAPRDLSAPAIVAIPGIDITTATPRRPPDNELRSKIPPPNPDLLVTSRERGSSITSSSSSHKSNSPFLSAVFTSGICIVCCEPDIPPLNRLAQCSECAALYHQSCHAPALTKAILEEAGEKWSCRICKQKRERAAKRGGLSVTLKRVDVEKSLEESVKLTKSSLSALLQRHAEWKSPTFKRMEEGGDRGREGSVRRESVTAASTQVQVASEKSKKGKPHRVGGSVVKPASDPAKEIPAQAREKSFTTSSKRTMAVTPASKVVSKPPTPVSRPSVMESPFQEASPAEAVPAIKPPKQAIPASQSSAESSRRRSNNNCGIFHPSVPPVPPARIRAHRKRELVISDSENESPCKTAKIRMISPRAAMKSALFMREKKGPLVSPLGPKLKRAPDVAKKSVVVARKAGGKSRDPGPKFRIETPSSERSESCKSNVASGKERGRKSFGTPVSPLQSGGILQYPQPPSPLPEARPSDPGGSQQYSLRLILTTGSNKNEPLVLDNEPVGYEYSTPYPIPLSRAIQRPVPPSPRREPCRDKNNFSILSLVPNQAVPVLDDGKLAFREGVIDARTGHLKRGARKFRVGKIVAGEIL